MGPHDDDHGQSPAIPATQDSSTDDLSLALIEEQADRSIRRIFHDGRWFFSVIDVIGLLTESPNPRNYWNMLKRRLAEEGSQETYTKCVQLRMTAERRRTR